MVEKDHVPSRPTDEKQHSGHGETKQTNGKEGDVSDQLFHLMRP